MSAIRIRQARTGDAPALAAIERAAAATTDVAGSEGAWADRIDAGEGTAVLVAERDGRPVGAVSLRWSAATPVSGEITDWYVHPEAQGEGVGRTLLRSGRRLLRNRGCTTIRVAVPSGANRASAVLAVDGWRPVGSGAGILLLERGLSGDEPYLVENRETWDEQTSIYAAAGREAWTGEPRWGVFGIPDDRVRILPDDLTGAAVVELGCGTGYVSAWCLRRGAVRAIGIDNSPAQLATAAGLAGEHRLPLHLVLGNAEEVPLAGASFDLAISEYGAAIWCDPYRWIPEAARLLRPGGLLIFLGNSALLMLCVQEFEDQPIGPGLLRPQRGMHRVDWADSPGVEFHVSHGEMIRLLRAAGFEVLDLVELYAEPEDTTAYGFVTTEWATAWPVEEVWIARRR
jgi:SAM-dependent methyltransferase/L-amino acid N-acyltransferase YncA